MEVHWTLPLGVAPASQALQRGGLLRQSKSAVGLCSLTLVCFIFLVPISHCDGFVVSNYLSWEWHCLKSAFDTAFSQCLLGRKTAISPAFL